MRTLEGKLIAEKIKVGVVAARFNDFIVSKLVGGCEDALLRRGVRPEDIDLAWVPGAFEIPLIASKMAKSGINPKTLQYIMGHADISVTLNTYSHVGFEDAREELSRVALG